MTDIEIRRATSDDVPAIVALLADDDLGAARETPDELAPYLAAFHEVDSDPKQFLAVAERGAEILGTLQLTLLPGLSHRGGTRAQLENVRVAAHARGLGLGGRLVSWAVARARQHGCRMVKLTSSATRQRAHRFYERLGFGASHTGYTLALDGGGP
ncbi:ribosomal protein S18 acetylase RimI-like enzyme [Haloactinospora alba]|uniref:Ribosomal protein S18 acetylase RimI-like enzyme n=1 Tax=Haloactinospora alba TaxID=405555 RepID=A0A543NKT4_9ACTN|nr:GNAT family N-acetyltransferase [Haloactinospora alba]TQN32412.1 ribosomal protein S18 acetylase RimI-like enzyme [Haloactinospora alba]